MNTFEIVSGSILILSCLLLITVVLMQQSKGGGLGSAISGESNSAASRSKNKSTEALLLRWTKILGVAMIVIVLAVNLVIRFTA